MISESLPSIRGYSRNPRVSPEEYAHIQTHVAIGVGILADLGLDHLIPGVWSHHEWLDGSGYPRGLRDGEIPLEGKVLAVADSVDAMSFSRIYRKTPRPSAEVDAILRDGVGGQWDATVVEAFLTRVPMSIDCSASRSNDARSRPGECPEFRKGGTRDRRA